MPVPRAACSARRARRSPRPPPPRRCLDVQAVPGVGRLAQGGIERHPAEQRHAELARQAARRRPSRRAPARRRRARTCSRPRRAAASPSCLRHLAARTATCCAAGCGVVTTSTSARGSSWPSEIATSPVPGGMSTTSVSSSPQCTSERNCSRALCSIGPRHITGLVVVEEEADRHQLQARRVTGGTIIRSTTIGRWCMPSMCGIEWP